MRILWASHSSQIGGAELCLLEGATAVRDQGAEVVVVVPENGPLEDRLQAASIAVVVVPYQRWAHPKPSALGRAIRVATQAQNAWRLRSVVDRVCPDVVVTNTVTIPAAALAARLAGVPHVWYIHEYGDLDHRLTFDYGVRASLQVVGALSDRVIVNSSAVGRHFARFLGRTPVDLVHYAVPLEWSGERPPAADAAFSVVLVGRKHPGKRQEDAVRALAILRRRGVDAALTLVGASDPGYDVYLRRLVADGNLTGHVWFVGHVADPSPHVAGADVALMCSANEAFGRVTVEAMKLGVPVVGAASGGTLDIVRDQETGLLYRPGDPTDLADKLEALHRDPAGRARMGRAARDDARTRFTMEKYGRRLLQTFERASTGRRRLPPPPVTSYARMPSDPTPAATPASGDVAHRSDPAARP